LSRALAGTTLRSSAHDRGRLLTQLAMTIAAGGRWRDQPAAFGTLASEATSWRAVHQVDQGQVDALVAVRQAATRRLLEHTDVDQIELEVEGQHG
jgi:hypothetical protein